MRKQIPRRGVAAALAASALPAQNNAVAQSRSPNSTARQQPQWITIRVYFGEIGPDDDFDRPVRIRYPVNIFPALIRGGRLGIQDRWMVRTLDRRAGLGVSNPHSGMPESIPETSRAMIDYMLSGPVMYPDDFALTDRAQDRPPSERQRRRGISRAASCMSFMSRRWCAWAEGACWSDIAIQFCEYATRYNDRLHVYGVFFARVADINARQSVGLDDSNVTIEPATDEARGSEIGYQPLLAWYAYCPAAEAEYFQPLFRGVVDSIGRNDG